MNNNDKLNYIKHLLNKNELPFQEKDNHILNINDYIYNKLNITAQQLLLILEYIEENAIGIEITNNKINKIYVLNKVIYKAEKVNKLFVDKLLLNLYDRHKDKEMYIQIINNINYSLFEQILKDYLYELKIQFFVFGKDVTSSIMINYKMDNT